MKYVLFFIVSCLFFFSCQEQEVADPILPFEKNYGSALLDYATAATNIGEDLYVVGTSKGLQGSTGGLLLLKVDAVSGNLLFEKSYGGTIQEQGFNIINTQDGNLLLLGLTEVATNTSGTQVDIFLVKVTPDGDTLWTKTYGAPESFDIARGLQETDNGDILIVGPTGNGSVTNIRVFRLDAQGKVLWEKIYNSPYNENGIDIAVIGNDTYFLLGRRQDGDDDFLLLKIDGQGNLLDTQTYGTPYYEEAHSIYKTKDGDFLLCGHSSGRDPLHNLYLLKVDATGTVLLEKHYGGTAHDGGTDAIELSNGDLVLVGETDSYGNGSKGAFFIRTDEKGEVLEENSYGGDLSDKFSAVWSTNGAYYMVGESQSVTTSGDADVYVVKKVE
ncbi:MAG: hypothetical protein ACRBFS_02835 [Aureispira sp.]